MRVEELASRDALLQAVKLLERQVLQLQKINAKLRARLAELEGASNPQQLEIDFLREQIDQLNAQLFAASSEKRHAEARAAQQPPRKPRKGHGPTPQPLVGLVGGIGHDQHLPDRGFPVLQGGPGDSWRLPGNGGGGRLRRLPGNGDPAERPLLTPHRPNHSPGPWTRGFSFLRSRHPPTTRPEHPRPRPPSNPAKRSPAPPLPSTTSPHPPPGAPRRGVTLKLLRGI